ncbi:hypothetical protein WOLCODRAFT_166987 [Wolfiporia cocos MD-104 SS10]|uniref:Uncharacterized protein n=1 Tax=Wolfiporia cocos (strain MD-104) TaxID=742152 RepID=A0A2H3JCU2_WOLCO|nr:hypothetical protein WOLCODRAFT_166987 [Wolfiporia cocos MD-104 SS10]
MSPAGKFCNDLMHIPSPRQVPAVAERRPAIAIPAAGLLDPAGNLSLLGSNVTVPAYLLFGSARANASGAAASPSTPLGRRRAHSLSAPCTPAELWPPLMVIAVVRVAHSADSAPAMLLSFSAHTRTTDAPASERSRRASPCPMRAHGECPHRAHARPPLPPLRADAPSPVPPPTIRFAFAFTLRFSPPPGRHAPRCTPHGLLTLLRGQSLPGGDGPHHLKSKVRRHIPAQHSPSPDPGAREIHLCSTFSGNPLTFLPVHAQPDTLTSAWPLSHPASGRVLGSLFLRCALAAPCPRCASHSAGARPTRGFLSCLLCDPSDVFCALGWAMIDDGCRRRIVHGSDVDVSPQVRARTCGLPS